MTAFAVPDPRARAAAARRAWMPRQHGAWAMLLLPILVGIAASRPDAWHVLLGAAAVTGYLASATLQAWSRSRRSPVYRRPLVAYGAAFASLSLPLVAAFPALLLVLVVAVPAGLIVAGGAKPGTKRDLANSLALVAQALVLVPAAAWVSGAFDAATVTVATGVTAGYLVSSVLAVRSVIRERSNTRFALGSAAFHLALVALAAWSLPPAYVAVTVLLNVRAIALPLLQRRLARGSRPLRPVHLGIVEIVSSILVVAVVVAVPLEGVLTP